jgi:hypothetical protein
MDREIEPLGLEVAVDSGKIKSDLKYTDVLNLNARDNMRLPHWV